MKERLQKIISRAGIASRRAAEAMMLAGRVTVDGKTVTEPGTLADIVENDIRVDGTPIPRSEKRVYFLLNKPKGYISTVRDERGRKTVLDLIPEAKERIYPVGRLDADTEGLLLLTNDGELANALLHPSGEVTKTYSARIAGEITPETLDSLRRGVKLSDGMTAPAKARRMGYDAVKNISRVELVIHEGRNREVRRMLEALGHEVKSLRRTEFAGLNLSGVKRGGHRPLTAAEIEYLKELAGKR